jgi:Family of unknown function (DUF5331)
MGDNMAFFYSFTDSLKHKWLQFFQVNRDWIMLHMQVESVYTPDGGKRPPSYLILGVVNALEPKLAQLMLPFSKLNPDADTLVEVLDLHFDPDIALGNSAYPKVDSEDRAEESATLMGEKTHEEATMHQEINGFGNEDNHQMAVESLMVTDTAVQQETIQMPVGNAYEGDFHHTPSPELDNEFGEISFDELKDMDINATSASDFGSSEEDAFRIVDDVWGEEGAAKNGGVDNEIFLGGELSTNAFDDTEIARLFPNN